MKLLIKDSTIANKGSFATKNIKSGVIILTFTGRSMTTKQLNESLKREEIRPDDPLQIDEDEHLELTDNSYYINHSSNPNTTLVKKTELLTIKNISKGEEITFDYSSTVG